MELRTSDALQIVQTFAKNHLESGNADLPDKEAFDDVLEAIDHLEKMIQCLKAGNTIINCGPS